MTVTSKFDPASDSALLERVRARVMATVSGTPQPWVTVRASDEGWDQLAPGVFRKLLCVSGSIAHSLVRMEAGAVVQGHLHTEDEECLVIEGTMKFGRDFVLYPGDFHIGRKGTVHEQVSTDTGFLVYLRSARDVVNAACGT